MAPVEVPAATVPQHLRALAQANAVRDARSIVKRRMRAGEITLEEAIGHPAVASMTVFDLLSSQRRWGRERTARFLAVVAIRETKACGSLTARQRELVVRLAR